MKRLLTLIFCLCFLFSTVCLAENRNPPNSKSQTTAKASFPNPFRPIVGIFRKILGRTPKDTYCPVHDVYRIILSLDQITLTEIDKIAVFAVVENPSLDPITYEYKVSGGKIIGRGEKVIWDLSGVKAGSYTITAKVNHDVSKISQTLIVKE